jgi:hypothetical protein
VAVITSTPPAIIAPSPSSSQSASQESDKDFASELAATHKDAPAKDAQTKSTQKKDAQTKTARAQDDARDTQAKDTKAKDAKAKDTQAKDAKSDGTKAGDNASDTEKAASQSDNKEKSKETQTAASDAQPVVQPAPVQPEEIPVAATPVTDDAQGDEIPAEKLPAAPVADTKPAPAQTQNAQQPQDAKPLTGQTLPVTQEAEETNKSEKPADKKADSDKTAKADPATDQPSADASAPPVAAPVTDVVPAMLPTPAVQSGAAPKAETTGAPKSDDVTRELRPTIADAAQGPKKPDDAKSADSKPTNPGTDTASKESQQASIPGQDPKADGQGDHHGKTDNNDRAGDMQAAQKPDAQTDNRIAADLKPSVTQTQPQAPAPASHDPHSVPQSAAVSGVSQPPAQPQTQVAANTAVAFHSTHDAHPAPEQLAVAISAQTKDGAKNFEIRLDPPELGRVEVKLSVDDTGKTQASLVVERPHTLEMLKADSRNLEQALKDSGLNLTDNGLNFSLKGQDRQAQQEQQNAPFVRAKILNMELTAAETAQAHINAMLPSGSTRLDIRV